MPIHHSSWALGVKQVITSCPLSPALSLRKGGGQETWTELSGVIIPLFDKGQNWPKELKRYFLSIWFRKKAWKWTVTFFLFIWNQFLCFLSAASSNGSKEGLARKLGRKYPESLAEKRTEGVFCPFTEEGQEGSFYNRGALQKIFVENWGICTKSNILCFLGIVGLIMDNQAYDHDMSIMNNNSARKKELEVGNFDNKASFMTINIRPVHKKHFFWNF